MADHIKRLEEIRNAAEWHDLAAVDVAALDAAIALMRGQSGCERCSEVSRLEAGAWERTRRNIEERNAQPKDTADEQ